MEIETIYVCFFEEKLLKNESPFYTQRNRIYTLILEWQTTFIIVASLL